MLLHVRQRCAGLCARSARPARRAPHETVLLSLGIVLLATLLLAACAGGSTTVAHAPTPTPPPAATATPALLYQADWSHGLAGWNASAGWSIVNGAAQSDTGTSRALTIPYQPTTPDYTVEFDLQVLAIPSDGGYYGLSAAPSASASGYGAGVYSLRAPGVPRPNGDHPTIFTVIEPQDAQDPSTIANSVKDFEPGDAVRTYRVEVSGNAALLYVDGHFFTSAQSIATAHLSAGPLSITCGTVAIRLVAVRIYAAP